MKKRPNIILITTDQQRFDTIQALGNDVIYTPHLNWLCDEGTVYRNMYADCPVCIASRTTIMSGIEGYRSGMVGNSDALQPRIMQENLTLPALLTQNGYQTRAVGKMHFTPVRANYGFEHIELPLDYYRMMKKSGHGLPKQHGVGENEIEPVISTVDEQHSITYWTVDRSIDFVETRDPTRPFFLWTSFTKPHPPFDPPANYWNLYETDDMPAPVYGDWSEDLQTMPKGFLQHTLLLDNLQRLSKKQQQASKRAYFACITQIDYSLGLLFARLRELGILDDTWIIFTSDHGDMLGDHHMGAKMTYFEGAAHVPMIIKAPVNSAAYRELKGKRVDSLVQMSSIYATVAQMAGIELPQDSDATRLSLLDFAGLSKPQTFYGCCEHSNYAVMDGGYKYIYTVYGGQEVLFYLPDDPMEQHNLANLPQEKDQLNRMRGLLREWAKQYDDDLLCGEGFARRDYAKTPEESGHWPGFHSICCEEFDVLH